MLKHITSTLKNISLTAALLISTLGAPMLVPAGVSAAPPAPAPSTPTATNPSDSICQGVKGATGQSNCDGSSLTTLFRNIINILLFVIGLIAVLMIIIGGIRYVVSGGDQSAITGAKNTILYAVVGLVVAMLAFAIVNFVVSKF